MVHEISPVRSRRNFLGLGGAAAAALLPGAAGPVPTDLVSTGLVATDAPPLRWQAKISADMPAPDPIVHLLSRAAFGPSPQDLVAARTLGAAAWIERQLAYEAIDASAVEGPLVAGLPTLAMNLNDLTQLQPRDFRIPDALSAATFYRQVFSPRQLYEVMVDFWSDHFNIYQPMENHELLKCVDDRKVIRAHALGRFKDLLTASAHSAAMLHYLNNDESTKDQPNENYAREIMELHTLGVAVEGRPYTETDVLELARCFTGWTWNKTWNHPVLGDFLFRPEQHDDGPKQVLGLTFPAQGGERDGRMAIDLLCAHPATARFLAFKLVRRFVCDDPLADVPSLVDRVAAAYTATDGDIKAMVRTILTSDDFAQSFAGFGGKLTRPMDLAVRMMRAADIPQAILEPKMGDMAFPFQIWFYELVGYAGYMRRMGQVPFGWLTPDGYADVKSAWSTTVAMLERWNMALGLANGSMVPGFRPHEHRPAGWTSAEGIVDHWIKMLLHRPMLPVDRQRLIDFLAGPLKPGEAVSADQREMQTVALILGSPYFQWR
ncbi:MAG: DUF1800 domain-containing protein [Anaerolineae bacterium]